MNNQELENLIRRHKHTGNETEKMNEGIRDILMSFETGETTTTKVYFPFAVRINKIRGIIMKAVAGTDNGTITCGNSIGNSTGGVITALASATLNTAYSVSPTSNNAVGKDSYYQLVSAKTTAGGKILVSLEYSRL